jgi:glycosyltransferase involved in cell wall biosynthesis
MVELEQALRAPAPRGQLDRSGPADTISVLVPAYNAAATIGEAIESVLVQRPAPEQVIVSDDGSDDELGAVLRPFGDRIDVVRFPHGGLAAARNRAAAVARGSLLALLDADDVWLPGRAAAFLGAAQLRPDIDIFTTDAFVARDGVRESLTYYATRPWPEEDQSLAIMRSTFIFGAAAVRRRSFERVGGYDSSLRFVEDWDLWIRMLVAGSRAALVDVPLYEYRRRSDSITADRVELAVGVLLTLDRAAGMPLTDVQREILGETIVAWRLRAAKVAQDASDGRRAALTRAAAFDRRIPLRTRARVLLRLLRTLRAGRP